MQNHTVKTLASGELSCSCGAIWDRDEGEECPADGSRPMLKLPISQLLVPQNFAALYPEDLKATVRRPEKADAQCCGSCPAGCVAQAAALETRKADAALSAPSHGEQVRDVSAMARVLSDRQADACNVDRDDQWKIYGPEFIEDVTAMLAAAPSAGSQGGDV